MFKDSFSSQTDWSTLQAVVPTATQAFALASSRGLDMVGGDLPSLRSVETGRQSRSTGRGE